MGTGDYEISETALASLSPAESSFDDPPSAAQGGKGVTLPGSCCRKRFGTIAQFLDHLTNDVLPEVMNKLSAQT
jgi:hypothetical protein